MNRNMRALIIAVMVVMIPVFLAAQTGMHGKMKAGEACCEDGMGLSKEVQLKLKKLHLENQMKNIDIVAEKEKLQEQLMEELTKEKASRKAVDKIAGEIASSNAKLHKNKIDLLFAAKDLLSPDQLKLFLKHHGPGMMNGCGGCCTGEMVKAGGCHSGGKCGSMGKGRAGMNRHSYMGCGEDKECTEQKEVKIDKKK